MRWARKSRKLVHNARRVTPIGNNGRKLLADTKAPFSRGQNHHAAGPTHHEPKRNHR